MLSAADIVEETTVMFVFSTFFNKLESAEPPCLDFFAAARERGASCSS
jgi:hypothetical protein